MHVHPTRRFAADHLGCPFGKTEAWVVLDVPSGGGTVFLGTTRPVRREEWAELVDAQATDAMLDLLHSVTVKAGDGVLVPSSTPHCIDAGVFIVELQEPTDFSVLLEWDGFDLDGPADGHLGLGFDIALDAVRTDAFSAADVDALVRRGAAAGVNGAPRRLLPDLADAYFRAWGVDDAEGLVTVPAAFSVVVVVGGQGTLQWAERQHDRFPRRRLRGPVRRRPADVQLQASRRWSPNHPHRTPPNPLNRTRNDLPVDRR